MITRVFNNTKGVVYFTSTGKVNLDEMFDSVRYLSEEPGLPRKLRILDNGIDAESVFGMNDIELILNALASVLPRFDTFRYAVIQGNPTDTAYAILAGRMINNENISIEVFSTLEAAENWLSRFDQN